MAEVAQSSANPGPYLPDNMEQVVEVATFGRSWAFGKVIAPDLVMSWYFAGTHDALPW